MISLDFVPGFLVGGRLLRWETLGIAAAIVLALVLAALIAGRTSRLDQPAPATRRTTKTGERRDHLSRADLLVLAMAAVPGAILGGRLGHGLLYADFYLPRPADLLDPSHGSLELGLAVIGGTLSAWFVGRRLDAPARRWLHVAAIPLLVGLAAGKLAMATGGSGQGLPSDLPWATAYIGPGPWGSLDPATPSHPAQVYEALLTLVGMAVLVLLVRRGAFPVPDGTLYLLALAVWAVARTLSGFAWRDTEVLGPLRAGQVIALGLGGVAMAGSTARHWRPTAAAWSGFRRRAADRAPWDAAGRPARPTQAGLTAPLRLRLSGQLRRRRAFLRLLDYLAAAPELPPRLREVLDAASPERLGPQWRAAQVESAVRRMLDATLADRRFTAAEEERLREVAGHLGVDLVAMIRADRALRDRVDVARASDGRLPTQTSAIPLLRGEVCHLQTKAALLTPFQFRSTNGSLGEAKWWPSPNAQAHPDGVASRRRLPRRARPADTGLLLVTSTRILYRGESRATGISLRNVAGYTVFRDGLHVTVHGNARGPAFRVRRPHVVAAVATAAASAPSSATPTSRFPAGAAARRPQRTV